MIIRMRLRAGAAIPGRLSTHPLCPRSPGTGPSEQSTTQQQRRTRLPPAAPTTKSPAQDGISIESHPRSSTEPRTSTARSTSATGSRSTDRRPTRCGQVRVALRARAGRSSGVGQRPSSRRVGYPAGGWSTTPAWARQPANVCVVINTMRSRWPARLWSPTRPIAHPPRAPTGVLGGRSGTSAFNPIGPTAALVLSRDRSHDRPDLDARSLGEPVTLVTSTQPSRATPTGHRQSRSRRPLMPARPAMRVSAARRDAPARRHQQGSGRCRQLLAGQAPEVPTGHAFGR